MLEQELPRGALRSQAPALELLRGAPPSLYALELLLAAVLAARDRLWDSPKHKPCSSMPRTSAANTILLSDSFRVQDIKTLQPDACLFGSTPHFVPVLQVLLAVKVLHAVPGLTRHFRVSAHRDELMLCMIGMPTKDPMTPALVVLTAPLLRNRSGVRVDDMYSIEGLL